MQRRQDIAVVRAAEHRGGLHRRAFGDPARGIQQVGAERAAGEPEGQGPRRGHEEEKREAGEQEPNALVGRLRRACDGFAQDRVASQSRERTDRERGSRADLDLAHVEDEQEGGHHEDPYGEPSHAFQFGRA